VVRKALELEHMDMARFLLTLRTPSRGWQNRLMHEDAFMIVEGLYEMESVRKFLYELWGRGLDDIGADHSKRTYILQIRPGASSLFFQPITADITNPKR